ncbi:MAG TPA: hypothetical protein VG147_08555 [Solirubrobacteraceae bacterium]|nr:hypothetical protein [Solirubrobacteraceae bacterium]
MSYAEEAQASCITSELALAWAMQPSKAMPQYWRQRLSVVRGFARHMQTLDPRTEVPPTDLLPALPPRRAVPYLYSEAEIQRLTMQASETFTSPLLAANHKALIGLLAVSGLRIGEGDRARPGRPRPARRPAPGPRRQERQAPRDPTTPNHARRARSIRPPAREDSPSPARARLLHLRSRHEARSAQYLETVQAAAARCRRSRAPPRLHDLRHSFVSGRC